MSTLPAASAAAQPPDTLPQTSADETAAEACASEAIHIPGAIQPHGAFLAIRASSMRVSHASANLETILGRPAQAVLGRRLPEVIGEEALHVLVNSARDDGAAVGSGGIPRVHVLGGPDGGALYLHVFRSGQYIGIDMEPMHVGVSTSQPILAAQTVLETFRHAASCAELCERAVHGLRGMTGFDRVMAYRFGHDGHGEVIAEARALHIAPYLGLHYPASDIPPQARALYQRQRVGAVADAAYQPVALLSDPAQDDRSPLDLTHSVLRSVSPVHREYMRNMGTHASLTLALTHGSELWGMLVCHHGAPRVTGPGLRAAVDMVGQVVSLLLASVGESEVAARRLERASTLRALTDRLATPLPLAEVFAGARADLLHLVDATGAVLRLSGVVTPLGQVPPQPVAALDLLWPGPDGRMVAVDDLGLRHPTLAGCTPLGSGVLLLPLPSGPGDAILWFRPEVAHNVRWGGNPNEHVSGKGGTHTRLSPRRSFAAWQEIVRGRSNPWTPADLALAQALHAAVLAGEVGRTRVALNESQVRLGLLAENSGVVVALCDMDGTRRYVSPAVERVIGWRVEEMLGRTALERVHPQDQQAVRNAITTLRLAEGRSAVCYRQQRPDGSWQWVDCQAHVHRRTADGTPMDYVVVLRDATERKAAEHTLVEALDRTERMAATDGLTGIANRRQFDSVIEREWRRCLRDDLPLSVLLIDADYFKLYNDRYGHLAGDDCLRALAGQMAAVAQRPGDLAARYGGEEFAVLLPATEPSGALRLAERLRGQIEDMHIVHADHGTSDVVTISIGVATACPGAACGSNAASVPQGVHDLLALADAALYQAKDDGRNRVVAADAGALAVQQKAPG